MASETFNLAILLSLRDLASGGLGRVEAQLRGMGAASEDALRTFGDLRQQLGRGLAIAGLGIAGLEVFREGVKVAASYQEAMTELRATMSEMRTDGGINTDKLSGDMKRAEVIAIRLGNALPGTTEDFIKMMQALKQNGLQTETIMNGAADAVGNLAVANNELPTDTAKNFAQFGQLYKINNDEYGRLADVFSKLYTSTGIGSSEIVEASKYFQGRAGSALGITGIEDAEKVVRLIGLMKKNGQEGSMAGTSLNDMFLEYLKHDKAVEGLAKTKGIKLDFFNKDGSFKDLGEIMGQMEQFRKLTEKERPDALASVFGIRGLSSATVMVNTGADGWARYNAEQEKTITLSEKNKAKAQDLNNKLETLSGTAKNLVVTVFEPMLPGLTGAANGTNTLVGNLQDVAKANPGIVSTTTTLAFLGTTSLIVVGGFKALSAAWQLWRIASSLGGGGAAASLNATGAAAATLRGRLAALASSAPVKIGLTIGAVMGLEYAVGLAVSKYTESLEAQKGKNNVIGQSVKTNEDFRAAVTDPKERMRLAQLGASTSFATLNSGNELLNLTGARKASIGERYQQYIASLWYMPGTKTMYNSGLGFYDKQKAVKTFQNDAPTLKFPEEMREFLRLIPQKVGSNTPEQIRAQATIKDTAALAFPESFKQAQQQLLAEQRALLPQQQQAQQQVTQGLTDLYQPLSTTTQAFGNLQQPIDQTGQSLNNLASPLTNTGNAANNAANSLNGLGEKISSFQMPTPQVQTYQIGIPAGGTINAAPTAEVPSRAIGGIVERNGLAMVHAGNTILPAAGITKGLKLSDANGGGGGIVVNYSPTVNSSGGGAASASVKKELDEHLQTLMRMLTREFQTSRERA